MMIGRGAIAPSRSATAGKSPSGSWASRSTRTRGAPEPWPLPPVYGSKGRIGRQRPRPPDANDGEPGMRAGVKVVWIAAAGLSAACAGTASAQEACADRLDGIESALADADLPAGQRQDIDKVLQ